MTEAAPTRWHDAPRPEAVRDHLARTGWRLSDADERTALWRLPTEEGLAVVLPVREDYADFVESLREAVRTIAFAESRTVAELVTDLAVRGGADTLSVRLTPDDAPSGSAPLALAQSTVVALHDLVVGSASGLEVDALVLPARRPVRAESYASQTLMSTAPGSFVVNLALPLLESLTPPPEADSGFTQTELITVPAQPYGRQVVQRMQAVVQRALHLADEVGVGDRPLRAFAEPQAHLANATELSALAALGGEDRGRYDLRFSRSPIGAERPTPVRVRVTPAQQRVLADAADYLRTKQPRTGVTVVGLVVRLHRTGNYGSGEVVVQGESDDSGAQRRFRMELSESEYNEAVRAHSQGLQVVAAGDLEFAGTRASLRRLSSFGVLPGID